MSNLLAAVIIFFFPLEILITQPDSYSSQLRRRKNDW